MTADLSTAIVFGGTTGIGAAAVRLFARRGVNVMFAGRQADAGAALVAELAGERGRVVFLRADVTEPDQVADVVAQTIGTFGGYQAAVNNAGVEGRKQPLQEAEEEEFDRVIGVNLKGLWRCMKHEIPHLAAAGGGAIINIASVGGLKGFPFAAIYSASKHGVMGLTKAAALELAPAGVRVNAIAPGAVRTALLDRMMGDADPDAVFSGMVPMKRLTLAEEVAEGIVWLASAAAANITGQVLSIDGGLMVA